MPIRKLFFTVLVSLYFFCIGYATLYVFQHNQFSDDYKILTDLKKTLQTSSSLETAIKKTNNLFNHHLHLVAIIFTTKKERKVFHTSIEEDKFPKINLKAIIKSITNNKDLSNFDKIKILQHKNILTPFNIYLIINKNITLHEFINLAYHYTYKLKYIIFIVISSSLLLLLLNFLYLFSDLPSSRSKKISSSSLPFEENLNITNSSFNTLRLHYITSILDYLANLLKAKKVTYYKLNKDEKFFPLYQKHEQNYIHYDDSPFKKKVSSIIETLDLKSLQPISYYQHENVMIISLFYKENKLLGILLVEEIENLTLKDDIHNYFKRIKNKMHIFGKNMYIYDQYENATLDQDSGFFTYPFFFFTLRERLLGGRMIAVLIFEFTNQKIYSKDKISEWYQEIWSIINSYNIKKNTASLSSHNLESFQKSIPADLPYRLEKNLFAIIFNIDNDEEQLLNDFFKQPAVFLASKSKKKVNAIQQSLKTTFGSFAKLEGGLILNPIGNTSLEVLTQHIEVHIAKMKKKGTYGSVI